MLGNKNIRNLFLGRLISASGDSLYEIAVIWYVFDLTKNAFYTGVAAAIVMLPKCFNFLLGPLIEEMNKRKVLIYAQFFQFLLMLSIPFGIWVGYESVFLVLAVMFFISFLENFQGTAEIAVVPKIVEKEERGKFNSLISSSQQLVDLSMKAVFAGFILTIGVQNIYLFNALTFLVAALFFSMLKVKQTNVVMKRKTSDWTEYKKSLKVGFIYFFTSKIVFICLPFLIANFSFGMAEAILPVYANERGGAEQYGIYILAISLGNLAGSLMVVKVMKFPLGFLMIMLPLLSFLLWASSIFTSSNWTSTVFLGLAFVPFGMMRILLITFLQTSIDENLLARVSSIIDSVIVSAMPLGALLGGMLSPVIGVNYMMLISSLGLIAIVFYFLLNKNIRTLPKIEDIKLQEQV
ncbi:MFS transporter [Planococcus maritimus]|nr:MFS transporter [Planococcus sp. SK3692]MDE4083571.1 MFS transporter [Planococcus maritimus]